MLEKEQAVLDFYQWEYRYRGHECYSYPVSIEVPYIPFQFNTPYHSNISSRFSLWSWVSRKFHKAESAHPSSQQSLEVPPSLERVERLSVFKLKILRPEQTQLTASRALISSLSHCQYRISFEVIGTEKEIYFQICCHPIDQTWVLSHLSMYFPSVEITPIESFNFPFDLSSSTLSFVDFGLKKEAIIPLPTPDNFELDPLSSFFAVLESLEQHCSCLLQIIFKGTDPHLKNDILYSVQNSSPTFVNSDYERVQNAANHKLESPLVFSSIRLVVQGKTKQHTQFLSQQFTCSIRNIALDQSNHLIALSNDEYEHHQQLYNIFHRTSNRHGMLLSINELLTFAHYPNSGPAGSKLIPIPARSKPVASIFHQKKYPLGINRHDQQELLVSLDETTRLKHTHILGSSGTGKSTLLTHLFLHDVVLGNGCALFDPYGDLVEDILDRIPKDRDKDVVLIDPSDLAFPIAFNLLITRSETEKSTLTAELSYHILGSNSALEDHLISVFSTTIDTFLNSTAQRTILEIKRFLTDKKFRDQVLSTLSDSTLIYYWNKEFANDTTNLSPLLDRIDAFLRPKLIRFMMAQKGAPDFRQLIDEKKIILFKLSFGLIGKDNACVLGSLFLSKINQALLSRQSLPRNERHPYFLYLDECQHFISSTIGTLLTAGQTYGVGITLSHQHISQIKNRTIRSLLLSNSFTKIYFQLTDEDAIRFESGLSFFHQGDLTNLKTGETIVRIGSSENDCNMTIPNLKEATHSISRDQIVNSMRNTYAKKRTEVEEEINASLSFDSTKKIKYQMLNYPPEACTKNRSDTRFKLRRHIQQTGQELGFSTSLNHKIHTDKFVDVSLIYGSLRVACEIYVPEAIPEKLHDIIKCFEAGYLMVLLICENKIQQQLIESRASQYMHPIDLKRTKFIQRESVLSILRASLPQRKNHLCSLKHATPISIHEEQLRKDIEQIIRKRDY